MFSLLRVFVFLYIAVPMLIHVAMSVNAFQQPSHIISTLIEFACFVIPLNIRAQLFKASLRGQLVKCFTTL